MKYSILCSHFKPAFNSLQKELSNLIPNESKVVVLPLAFPVETDYQDLENNYHGYKAWYLGFSVLKEPYYIDVHNRDDDEYLKQLQKISNKRKKIIYALHEEDSILYNRDTGAFNLFGNINIIKPE